jgi:hypothetical protein
MMGTLTLFLQKSVDFPLEKVRLFGALPAAASWQSSCQRSFVVSTIKKFLKRELLKTELKMRTPFKWLL